MVFAACSGLKSWSFLRPIQLFSNFFSFLEESRFIDRKEAFRCVPYIRHFFRVISAASRQPRIIIMNRAQFFCDDESCAWCETQEINSLIYFLLFIYRFQMLKNVCFDSILHTYNWLPLSIHSNDPMPIVYAYIYVCTYILYVANPFRVG